MLPVSDGSDWHAETADPEVLLLAGIPLLLWTADTPQ